MRCSKGQGTASTRTVHGIDWDGGRTVPIRVRSARAKVNDVTNTGAAGIDLLYAARRRERIDKYLVLKLSLTSD